MSHNIEPSFFKVLFCTDFTRLLRLPPLFSKKYGSILPLNAKLRISSGRRWSVKVEQIKEGLFGFTQGWQSFVEDVGLKFGEFLVFKFNCNSTFHVTVFETSACEKEINTTSCSFKIPDSDYDELKTDICKTNNHNARDTDVMNKRQQKARNNGGPSKSDGCSPLYFEIQLKQHHKSRISLTRSFSMAAGLMGKKRVELEYASTQCYRSVVLDTRERQGNRIDMAKGWNVFRKTNGLVFGRTYSFEFQPTKNLIRVKEVKKGK